MTQRAGVPILALAVLVVCLPGCLTGAMRPQTAAGERRAPAPADALWAIFVDDLHLDFANTGRLRQLVRTMGQSLIHDGDVVTDQSTGHSSLMLPPVRGRSALEGAVSRISGGGLRPSELLAGPEAPEVLYRAAVALKTAHAMMQELESVPARRKAVLYISNGYGFDTWPDGTPGSDVDPFAGTLSRMDTPRLRAQLSAVTRAAVRSRATVFAMDPRFFYGGPQPGNSRDTETWQRHTATTRNSLRVMAEGTGGFLLNEGESVDDALRRIRAAVGR